MNKRFLIIGGVVLLVLLATLFFINRTSNEVVVTDTTNVTPAEDPLDNVLSFYNEWLQAEKSTTTNPIEVGLLDNQLLTTDVRESIEKALSEKTEGSLNPVLCQLTPPSRIGAKVLYQLDTEAEIRILARGEAEKSPNQAIVKLKLIDNVWRITNITCASGETGPVREFDFENEGFLLKNVPPPLNPDLWHLVFEQDGVMGHTVPLYFSVESICIAPNGTESTCDTSTFTDATKVFLQAGMTEEGAQVKRLRF